MMQKRTLWAARILIGIVTFFNLECAFSFLIDPGSYTPAYELTGVVGHAMVRAMGLLFIMWNVPYVFALIHPLRHKVSLVEAVIMQAIGVIGETILLLTLPGDHPILAGSVLRFILFDGGGLILLLIAFLIIKRQKADKKENRL